MPGRSGTRPRATSSMGPVRLRQRPGGHRLHHARSRLGSRAPSTPAARRTAGSTSAGSWPSFAEAGRPSWPSTWLRTAPRRSSGPPQMARVPSTRGRLPACPPLTSRQAEGPTCSGRNAPERASRRGGVRADAAPFTDSVIVQRRGPGRPVDPRRPHNAKGVQRPRAPQTSCWPPTSEPGAPVAVRAVRVSGPASPREGTPGRPLSEGSTLQGGRARRGPARPGSPCPGPVRAAPAAAPGPARTGRRPDPPRSTTGA